MRCASRTAADAMETECAPIWVCPRTAFAAEKLCWNKRFFFFFHAEDGIRDDLVTGVQTCALPISPSSRSSYKCQTKDGSHSGRCDGADPDNVSRRSTSDLANIRFKATDDDLGLIVLGKQLEEAVAKIRALYDPSSPDHLEQIGRASCRERV